MRGSGRPRGRGSPGPGRRGRQSPASPDGDGAAGSQTDHGRSAIGHDLLTRDVARRGDGAGEAHVVYQIAAPARLQIAHDTIALAVDMWIDAVCRLWLPWLEDHAHVLVGGTDPHERQTVEQPDPDVMADAHVWSGQLVGQILTASGEVLRAHGGADCRPARDGGGQLLGE